MAPDAKFILEALFFTESLIQRDSELQCGEFPWILKSITFSNHPQSFCFKGTNFITNSSGNTNPLNEKKQSRR